MYEVKTADGLKYVVQLVGPRSYRMGGQMTYRGQTLTVTKRTRDYLVRKTDGAWADYDPTPPEPVDEILPPQFGEAGGPMIDMDDIDPKANPPLSPEQAAQLAGHEVATHTATEEDAGIDTADLAAAPVGPIDVPNESGDLTGKDLAKTPAPGGKTAAKPKAKAAPKAQAKPADADLAKTGGVTIKNAPKSEEGKQTAATTVS